MQGTAAAHHKAVGGLARLHTQSQVALQLTLQPLLEVPAGHELALLAGKGGGVDLEGHAHGGVLNLDGGQGDGGLPGADGLPDLDVRDTAQGADVTRSNLLHTHAVEVVVHKQLRNLVLTGLAGLQAGAHRDGLPLPDGAVDDAADRNAPQMGVVVNVGHEHLQGGSGRHHRGLHLLDNGLEEGLQVISQLVGLQACDAVDS
mmetsp:Transcript_3232/g.7094  ORF Transcript_3232/g.7094 Transcript_3232/m.7094 type:complete len:202 (+) Transcript_3232:1327-1932(+)